jgi:diacylglycerol kinase (ATP)
LVPDGLADRGDKEPESGIKVSISRKLKATFHRPLRAKLIFNAGSGKPEESPQQLASILSEMQNHQILAEVYSVRPDSQLETVVRNAIKTGIKLIVVAGGDGTIDSVMGAMVGSDAILGIIPTGTRNNVAFNLGIPGDIAKSVALLRRGRSLKIDVGKVHCGHSRHWFLEAAALGLLSDLYPLADDIQHGNLTMIGELLSTLVSATPAQLHITLDEHKHLDTTEHMLLISNMSFLGPHFQISPKVSFKDGYLDVFTFSDMSKLNMISYAMLAQIGLVENIGIKHYRVKHVKIRSIPHMPILADGVLLGQGSLSVRTYPRALTIMAGPSLTGRTSRSKLTASKLAVNG